MVATRVTADAADCSAKGAKALDSVDALHRDSRPRREGLELFEQGVPSLGRLSVTLHPPRNRRLVSLDRAFHDVRVLLARTDVYSTLHREFLWKH